MFFERPGTNSFVYAYNAGAGGNLTAVRNSWGQGSDRAVALSRHLDGFCAPAMDGHSEKITLWPINHSPPAGPAQGWGELGDAKDEVNKPGGFNDLSWNAIGAKLWVRENLTVH
jgi:hypothetical protein